MSAVPSQVGRYRIESELARGAMGVVYRATDPRLERSVAIKLVGMALEGDGSEHYEARFYQEARAAAGLNHPNIVTVYDVGKSGDAVFMAMEFIDGPELRGLLAGGRPLPLGQAVSVAAQIAEGLGYAHDRGVVHRDIKPANIMVVPDGPVKITDFGIARRRSSAELTQAGAVLGTPRYMSPEQVIGKRADQRADLFSLGVIAYEMLTGVAPFGGENATALMYQIVNLAPPAPSSLNPQVPQALDHAVARLLAKPLEERYQSARDAARDLRGIERQLGASAAAEAPPRPPAAGLARGAQPALLDPSAKATVLAQSLDRTRRSDASRTEAPPPPERGVSRGFDSTEATQRLATLTGGATAPGAARAPVRHGWRRRDWLLFGAAAALGLILSRGIARGATRSRG